MRRPTVLFALLVVVALLSPGAASASASASRCAPSPRRCLNHVSLASLASLASSGGDLDYGSDGNRGPRSGSTEDSGLLGGATHAIGKGIAAVGGGIDATTGLGVPGAVSSVFGAGEQALADAALDGLGHWIAHGAQSAVRETAHVLGAVTAPQLTSTWFSATYWRLAGIGALLTVPFLFATAVQAVVRGDLALLGRAALGHLPLALLVVSLAAPLVMLLLAATDEMCAIVSRGSGASSAGFLSRLAGNVGDLAGGSSFFLVVLAFCAGLAAIALTLEMLIRAAAVYVVVLMLPLAFAALVWPSRRIWAARLLELLAGLILSKFVIVAVLTLAGAAIAHTAVDGGVAGLLAGVALLLLSVLAPWTVIHMLPFSSGGVAAGAGVGAQVPRATRAAYQYATAEPDPATVLARAISRQSEAASSQPETAGADSGPLIRARAAERSSQAVAGRLTRGAPRGGGEPSQPSGPEPEPNATATTLGSPGDGAGPAPKPLRDTTAPDFGSRGEERSPGMADIWQEGNGEWPPISLGPGGYGGPVHGRPAHEPSPGSGDPSSRVGDPSPGVDDPSPGAGDDGTPEPPPPDPIDGEQAL